MNASLRVIKHIPPSDLIDSPFNRRKDWGDLDGLADDIKTNGVLQPLRARPITGNNLELVFGHRRKRAALIASLDKVPVVVTPMTDTEVLLAQLSENLQRQNLHPIHEAEYFELLHTEHKVDIDELAAKVGRSRSYIYGRLALCKLIAAAKKACLEGEIGISVALQLARMPSKALQREVLNNITSYDPPLSARDVAEIIEDDFMLRLDEAPFDVSDASLVKKAGACTTCPKRTGSQPDLFDDISSPDICTDKTCHKRKCDAAWEIRVKAAPTTGETVLSEAQCKKEFNGGSYLRGGSPYIDLNATCYDDPKRKPWRDVLGKDKPPVTIARDGNGRMRELVNRKDVNKALKDTGHPAGKPASKTKADPEQKKQREQAKQHRVAIGTTLDELIPRVAKRKPQPADFWRLLVRGLLAGGWHETLVSVAKRREIPTDDVNSAFAELLPEMSIGQLQALALELTVSRGVQHNTASLEAACKLYDVNWKAHQRKAKRGAK